MPKIYAPLPNAGDASADTNVPAPWRVTLASDQDVNFFIHEFPYTDKLGGVSIEVSAVPLRASLILFTPALFALRGRRS